MIMSVEREKDRGRFIPSKL